MAEKALYRLADLAEIVRGEVVGEGEIVIRGVGGIREALPGDITFIANARYEMYLLETRASAVICARNTAAARGRPGPALLRLAIR